MRPPWCPPRGQPPGELLFCWLPVAATARSVCGGGGSSRSQRTAHGTVNWSGGGLCDAHRTAPLLSDPSAFPFSVDGPPSGRPHHSNPRLHRRQRLVALLPPHPPPNAPFRGHGWPPPLSRVGRCRWTAAAALRHQPFLHCGDASSAPVRRRKVPMPAPQPRGRCDQSRTGATPPVCPPLPLAAPLTAAPTQFPPHPLEQGCAGRPAAAVAARHNAVACPRKSCRWWLAVVGPQGGGGRQKGPTASMVGAVSPPSSRSTSTGGWRPPPPRLFPGPMAVGWERGTASAPLPAPGWPPQNRHPEGVTGGGPLNRLPISPRRAVR